MDIEQDIENLLQLQPEENENRNGLEPSIEEQIPQGGEYIESRLSFIICVC